MQKVYRISSSYKIPASTNGGRYAKYPWALLKVGQSFLIKKAPKRIHNQCYHNSKKLGHTYACQMQGVSARVWRTK